MPYTIRRLGSSVDCLKWDDEGKALLDVLVESGLLAGFSFPDDEHEVVTALAAAAEATNAFVVVEKDYYDLDIRSEVRYLVQRLYDEIEMKSPRIHLFADLPDEFATQEILDADGPLANATYLGYTVVRLRGSANMGRTMLAPELFGMDRASVRCALSEKVSLFGVDRTVIGFPFMQQDRLLTSCFHANLWMVCYAFTLRGILPRTTAGTIGASLGELGEALSSPTEHPSFPNEAISLKDAADAARRQGLVVKRSEISSDKLLMRAVDEIEAHLNSGFPLSVTYKRGSALCDHLTNLTGSVTHSVLAIGFERCRESGEIERLIVHDDQAGLYKAIPVEDLIELSASTLQDQKEIECILRKAGVPDWYLDSEPQTHYAQTNLSFFAPQGVWVASASIPSAAANSVMLITKGLDQILRGVDQFNSMLGIAPGSSTGKLPSALPVLETISSLQAWSKIGLITQAEGDSILRSLANTSAGSPLHGTVATILDRVHSCVERFRDRLAVDFVDSDKTSRRYYVCLGTDFKSRFIFQNRDLASPTILRHLAALSLPKFVWVIEFMNKAAWMSDQIEPCVVGEVIYNASSPSSESSPLWVRSRNQSYRSTLPYYAIEEAEDSLLTYSNRSSVVTGGPPIINPYKSATRDGF